jgi:hypothetical protein
VEPSVAHLVAQRAGLLRAPTDSVQVGPLVAKAARLANLQAHIRHMRHMRHRAPRP